MVEWSEKVFEDVVWSVWRMFGEGSEVRWCVEMVENGGGSQTAAPSTGREDPATGRPRLNK